MCSMPNPSEEQLAILNDSSRVRLVRAAPGSGKTWLVGEIIRREIGKWSSSGGIAALSFTRVGGEEIRKAVGYEIDSPHFVGTLDSFLFKYIVKPFWKKIHPNYTSPRLVPAESGVEKWTKMPDGSALEVSKNKYNLLKITYNGLDCFGNEILTYKNNYGQDFEIISGGPFDWVRNKKREFIQKSGWMTHADVALCSYRILSDVRFGIHISALLGKRFPFLVVDEMQDTGFFAGKTVLQLLQQSIGIKALLVGDPNQAIYEFNGATPQLFNTFQSIGSEIPLETSRRCPKNITSLANNLIVNSIKDNGDVLGKNTLVIYSDFEKDIPELISKLNDAYKGKKIKFVTRLNKTVYKLRNDKNKEPSKLGCPALTHMSSAIQAFYRGNNIKAYGLAEACISLWLFQYEGITDDDLEKKKISNEEWKHLIVSCLLNCARINDSLTYEEWQKEAGVKIEEVIKNSSFLSTFKIKTLKPTACKDAKKRKKNDRDVQMSIFFPSIRKKIDENTLQTIHSVKGETHDATVLVIPPVGRGKSRSPSDVWWSTNSADEEEKRIAYVAITRSRKDFYLVVPDDVANELFQRNNDFYNMFEIKNIADYIPKKNLREMF